MTRIAPAPPRTVVVISDLHMAAGRRDPFVDDRALVAWLERLVERARAGERLRLVLLGDTLDFTLVEHAGRRLDPTPAGALARLELIARAHREVFAALARTARAGVALDVVAGNHDLELLLAEVGARLRALLAPGRGELSVHPWLLHLPGLAHLEHGQQHHDVNHVPALLDVAARGRLTPPAGTVAGECLLRIADALGLQPRPAPDAPSPRALAAAALRRPRRSGAVLAALGAAARDVARTERAARLARRAAGSAAAREAVALGLPAELAAEIERTSATLPSRALRRVAAGGRREHYMVAGARAVHALLAARGHAVAFYVLAHTHVPADRPLTADPQGPRYLNAGTWSLAAPAGTPRRCHVELSVEAGAPVARLVGCGDRAARASGR